MKRLEVCKSGGLRLVEGFVEKQYGWEDAVELESQGVYISLLRHSIYPKFFWVINLDNEVYGDFRVVGDSYPSMSEALSEAVYIGLKLAVSGSHYFDLCDGLSYDVKVPVLGRVLSEGSPLEGYCLKTTEGYQDFLKEIKCGQLGDGIKLVKHAYGTIAYVDKSSGLEVPLVRLEKTSGGK